MKAAAAAIRDSLFPAAEVRRTVSPAAVVVRYILAAAVGFSIDLWWSGTGITSRVWAEDGAVFLSNAHRTPFLTALATPYAGYLQATPRLLATFTTAFPLRDAAWLLAASAAATRVAVALFLFRASSGHLRSTWVRAMLAVAVVLLPVGGLEVLDNTANLHWFLTFAAFWAVLWRPSRRSECVVAALVVVLAVDGDPLTVFLLPLVLLRAIAVQHRRDQIVTVCFAAAGIFQAWAILRGSRPQHETINAATVMQLFGTRVLIGTLAGYWHTAALWQHWHYAAVGIGTVALLALITPAIRIGGHRRWLAISASAGSALTFAACFVEPAVAPHLRIDLVRSLDRYDVLPSLLMLTAVAAGLDALHWPADIAVRGVVGAVFLTALPVDMVGSAQVWAHLERTVPTWPAAVADAKLTCELQAAQGASNGEVTVPEMPEGWRVQLPCAAVDH